MKRHCCVDVQRYRTEAAASDGGVAALPLSGLDVGQYAVAGGYNFETPPPMITKEGFFKPLPPTGARTLDSRTAFSYGYTMDSPGMIMRLPNVGLQYLMGFLDADKNPLDGAKTNKVTLPKDIPAGKFWSSTVYDSQTRSMLQTPQRYPRAESQTYPTTAAVANPDGATTIYFGPSRPANAKDGNWIQTMPNRAGSRFSVSIVRSDHSSQSSGDQAKSKS